MNRPIDLVVPYVNSLDVEWQKTFIETLSNYKGLKAGYTANRFRDFNTFRYFFRAVQQNLPWIRKVFVVLQSPSQKSEWLKEDNRLKIVYHNEFIPEQYLPTYNSATIELFVWKIEGLSEHYIYFNDDIFVLNELKENDFFDEKWNPVLSFGTIDSQPVNYGKMIKNTEILARVAANKFDGCDMDSWISDGHGGSPMKKSTWKKLFGRLEENIKASITPFRNPQNVVHQLSAFYFYFTKKYSPKHYSVISTEFETFTADQISGFIRNSEYDVICINDSGCNDYVNDSRIICEALEEKFPEKSWWEM